MLLISSLGILLIVIAILWQTFARAREQANKIIDNVCHKHQLQRLDGSTVLTRQRLARDASGRIGVMRKFEFECFKNDIRQAGSITLLHKAIIDLETPDFAEEADFKPPSPANEKYNNIIHFPRRDDLKR